MAYRNTTSGAEGDQAHSKYRSNLLQRDATGIGKKEEYRKGHEQSRCDEAEIKLPADVPRWRELTRKQWERLVTTEYLESY